MARAKQKISSSKKGVIRRTTNGLKQITVSGVPHRKHGNVRRASLNSVTASMSLDEMLEASSAATKCLRGEAIPVLESKNVKAYVGHVSRLGKKASTRKMAESMVNALNVQIVEKNKKSANNIEARRLYSNLMNEK